MQTGGLTFTDAVSLASWIAPRLTASLGSVASVVPYGYPAYARICHPVPDGLGGWNSWSEVAAAKGTTAHALMQWHAVLGSSEQPGSRGAVWPGEPTTGNLATHTLHALCAILAAHLRFCGAGQDRLLSVCSQNQDDPVRGRPCPLALDGAVG